MVIIAPPRAIRRSNKDRQGFNRKCVLIVLLCALLCFFWRTDLIAVTSVIPVARFQDAPSENGLPSGWTVQKYKGTPHFKVNHSAENPHLQMISTGETAFGFKKDLAVDIREYRYLNWNWKSVKLPDGGDIRQKERDDQSIQIYLVFQKPGFNSLFSKPPALAYIWDNKAPKESLVKSPQALLGNVRYIVVRNGEDKLGKWFVEKRNIFADYCRTFGGKTSDRGPVMVTGVLLFINTHHTRSDAEGCIGNMYFSNQ